MSLIIVQHGRVIILNSSNQSNTNGKDDIINASKAAVRKSILMQITRAKASGFH
jgi:hypothetical protein